MLAISLRVAGEESQWEEPMRALHQAEDTPVRAESSETPARQTSPLQTCEARQSPPRTRTSDTGDRRFLTALLRALSAWST